MSSPGGGAEQRCAKCKGTGVSAALPATAMPAKTQRASRTRTRCLRETHPARPTGRGKRSIMFPLDLVSPPADGVSADAPSSQRIRAIAARFSDPIAAPDMAGAAQNRPQHKRTARSRHGPAKRAGASGRSGEGRTRTGDTPVFSRVLYQLSYLAAGGAQSSPRACEEPRGGRRACRRDPPSAAPRRRPPRRPRRGGAGRGRR